MLPLAAASSRLDAVEEKNVTESKNVAALPGAGACSSAPTQGQLGALLFPHTQPVLSCAGQTGLVSGTTDVQNHALCSQGPGAPGTGLVVGEASQAPATRVALMALTLKPQEARRDVP